MAYMMPIHREKAAIRLARMLRHDGSAIARALVPRMARVLKEGEEMPDVAHLLDVLGRMVVAEHRDIYDADELQDEHGTDRYFVRRDLNKVAQELRRRVVKVRGWLRNNYGAPRAKALLRGFEGRTPRGSEELADLATIMVRRLPSLKPKQGPGGDIDPAKWSEYLRLSLEKTSDLLLQRGFRNDDVEIATKVKGNILVAFDKTYRRVLRLAEIFYLLAGLVRTAKKLRDEGGRPAEKIKKQRPTGVA